MKKLTLLFIITLLISSCSSDDDNGNTGGNNGTDVTRAQVISNYANVVYTSYLDSYNTSITLKTAIDAFVDAPSESGFTAAKNAWLAAREPYGQTEAYRGANGPIDSETNDPWVIGNEGQLNAWPMEEAIIDYVTVETEDNGAGSFDFGSIISDTSITIDETTVISFAETGNNEAAVTTGWHAIEFLLWGQDNTMPSEDIPGLREWTDYTTADFATRRGQYLKVVTNLLVNDLNDLVSTWNSGGTYRTVFDALDENTAIRDFITGAFFIAGDELSSERMLVAVDSDGGLFGLGQEDEHSCFSDNTHRDIFGNAKGVYNVIFGEYTPTSGAAVSGASFYDLVKQADETQAQALKDAADEAMSRVNVIANNAQPFDLLITLESVEGGQIGPVVEAARALEDWADQISASATAIGINL